jgi:hypothetical protein
MRLFDYAIILIVRSFFETRIIRIKHGFFLEYKPKGHTIEPTRNAYEYYNFGRPQGCAPTVRTQSVLCISRLWCCIWSSLRRVWLLYKIFLVV